MKTQRDKAPKRQRRKYKRAVSLGRSPLTGVRVLKPVAKGASITMAQARKAVRALKPLNK